MKKMRRLIPAIAMLLVSAVMLSTASFAWFTMNTDVTASGMQIQAKADSSLLIGQAPLTAAGNTAGKPSLQIETGVQNLYPMAYSSSTVEGAQLTQTTDGWYIPTENDKNDINTGLNTTGNYTQLDEATDFTGAKKYSYKEEFYIATAGDAVTTDLNITLGVVTAPASGETYKAYAAAIYVISKDTTEGSAWLDDKDIAIESTKPTAIIFVDEYDNRNTYKLTGVTIPSVASAVDADSAVGLKIIIHFYVDGALVSNTTTTVNSGSTYTAADSTWSASTSYYNVVATPATGLTVGTSDVTGLYVVTTNDAGKTVYTPATGKAAESVNYASLDVKANPIPTDEMKAGTENIPSTWFTAKANPVESEYTYVRSSDIPANGTALEITFAQ